MASYKDPTLQERTALAKAARDKALAKLAAKPKIDEAVLAERIVTWRAANGRFTRVAELTEVSGIGPALFADLEPLVTVAG